MATQGAMPGATGQNGDRMPDAARIAAETLAALDNRTQVTPVTDRVPDFDFPAAYRVTAEHRRLRSARGETRVGRKLGFTNRNLWAEFGVDAPIWGDVFDTTFREVDPAGAEFDLAAIREAKIEPEIAFGLTHAPEPGMDEAALIGCIGWVAHGIEIVQSLYPGWKFRAPDTMAGFGMHGAYLMGPRVSVAPGEAADWVQRLADFHITISRDGQVMDRGHSSDVLGGPLSALRHMVALLDRDPANPQLGPGEFVTTGTVTRVFDIRPGATWQTLVEGLPLPGLRLVFR